jgi:YD repeat-containing protein
VYDAASRLISQTDRNGDTLTSSYDTLGRLERVDGPDAWVSFGYDAIGHVVSVSNPKQVRGFTWGVDGELVTATSGPALLGAYPELSDSYTWTLAGRLEKVDSGFGTVRYVHDLRGRVVSQVDSVTDEVPYGWDAEGRLTSLTRASGWTTTYSVSTRLRHLPPPTVSSDQACRRQPWCSRHPPRSGGTRSSTSKRRPARPSGPSPSAAA